MYLNYEDSKYDIVLQTERIYAMSKNHPILKTIAVIGTAVLSIEAWNRMIFKKMQEKESLTCVEGDFYEWKHGTFFYKKITGGAGHPIVILHDLFPNQNADNCDKLMNQLAQHRTVYSMDLLGCGRSDKPAITYTNFLYVLQVVECIEKIVGQPVHLVAKGRSAAIAVAVAKYKPEYVVQLSLLDPVEEENKKMPDQTSKLLKALIELPVFGTLLYHMAFSNSESAHMGGANARYLYASIVGRYTNMDVEWMPEELDIPIHVIELMRVRTD